MPEDSDFQAFYLREIGVHTPLMAQSEQSAVDGVVKEKLVLSPTDVLSQKKSEDDLQKTHQGTLQKSVQVSTTAGTKAASMSAPLQELAMQAATCRGCQLAAERNNVVFGTGNPEADIVFIGEAPGRDEDLKGEPFVGRSGKLLDRMLVSLGMDRSQVYIMNTVKCRPPNNRDPKPEEVEACGKWFDAQLKTVAPKLICLLGRVAAQTVLETDAPLATMREKWHEYHGIPVLVMYHPAYLLRSPQQKSQAWRDLCTLRQRYHS